MNPVSPVTIEVFVSIATIVLGFLALVWSKSKGNLPVKVLLWIVAIFGGICLVRWPL